MAPSDGSQRIILDLPEWLESLQQVAAAIEKHGSFPRAVFALISAYILDVIFGIFGTIAGAILFAFDVVVGVLGFAQRLLVNGFGIVGIDILGALAGVQRAIAGAIAGSGPLAPVFATLLAVGTLYVLYRLAVALLGELPVGSTIVDLLGLR